MIQADRADGCIKSIGCGEAMDTADVLFVPITRRETRAFLKIHCDGVDMDALSAR